MHRFPVVVVGGGPVGWAWRCSFQAQRAVSDREPETDPGWHPKGNTHNSRTMEHYRRLGCRTASAPWLATQHPTDVGYFTTLSGPEIARIPMPSEAEKMEILRMPRRDQVVEPIFRCNQMYVERFLLNRFFNGKDRVQIRLGVHRLGGSGRQGSRWGSPSLDVTADNDRISTTSSDATADKHRAEKPGASATQAIPIAIKLMPEA